MYTSKLTNRTRLQKAWKSYQLPGKTVYLQLVIDLDNSGTLTWKINTSFTVHLDCKSHTRACLTLGHESLLSLLFKQQINSKTSPEAELVGVDDTMIFVRWMEHFFESQVSSINVNSWLKPLGSDVTIEQDNTSGV